MRSSKPFLSTLAVRLNCYVRDLFLRLRDLGLVESRRDLSAGLAFEMPDNVASDSPLENTIKQTSSEVEFVYDLSSIGLLFKFHA